MEDSTNWADAADWQGSLGCDLRIPDAHTMVYMARRSVDRGTARPLTDLFRLKNQIKEPGEIKRAVESHFWDLF